MSSTRLPSDPGTAGASPPHPRDRARLPGFLLLATLACAGGPATEEKKEPPAGASVVAEQIEIAKKRRAAGDPVGAFDAADAAHKADFRGTRTAEISRLQFEIGAEMAEKGYASDPIGLFPTRSEGIRILKHVAEKFPTSDEAAEALFLAGEATLATRDPYAARRLYDELIARYPESPRAEFAELQRAYALYEMSRGPAYDRGPLEDARWRLQMYRVLFPAGHPTVRERAAELLRSVEEDLAEKDVRAAEHYRSEGKPAAAALYYRFVRDHLPATTWAKVAAERLAALEPGK
ncbi:MAG: outer membrane protein assembly factor BamD [Planctomycetales bacterium]|nr:outer membrane protein assembly factor BamD [Planctomycetales bacterium]